jgi:hypothetical protein
MERICARIGGDTFSFMNREERVIAGSIHVLGTTLWTSPPPDANTFLVNDYHPIRSHVTLDPIDPEGIAAMHTEQSGWLSAACANITSRAPTESIVIVTHHSPSSTLAGIALNGQQPAPATHHNCRQSAVYLPFYYATGLANIWSNNRIAAWCYGHTHETGMCNAISKNSTLFCTNALGYHDDQNPGFRRRFLLSVL